jgi:hypothetical protein
MLLALLWSCHVLTSMSLFRFRLPAVLVWPARCHTFEFASSALTPDGGLLGRHSGRLDRGVAAAPRWRRVQRHGTGMGALGVPGTQQLGGLLGGFGLMPPALHVAQLDQGVAYMCCSFQTHRRLDQPVQLIEPQLGRCRDPSPHGRFDAWLPALTRPG